MQLFLDLQNSIIKNHDRNAFYINDHFYDYKEFAKIISKIRKAIQNKTLETEKNIGLVVNNDLETYASIVALWLEGKAYVPISKEIPKDRNYSIIRQANLNTIIDSSDIALFSEYAIIESKKLQDTVVNLIPNQVSDSDLVFILFTSGTTGEPKGVPISRSNLSAFVEAFWTIGFEINQNDKCLQMFELTFDLSVMSYLIPLLRGACVFTVPDNKIKYSYIYELMEDQKLTFALMVPSILHYLRPYFNEIDLPDMKYSLFCGEALPLDITEEWSKCLPNAKIFNVYGPTEDTIFCTHYELLKSDKTKSHNGILSIGKAMQGSMTVIINDNNEILSNGEIGQLCLGGTQLTAGYWRNEAKNLESFFNLNYKGKEEKFYKTGDLCKCDSDGNIYYIGRIDFQTKIQGFRVELSEVDFHVKEFLKKSNVLAIAFFDIIGNKEIGLAIEGEKIEVNGLLDFLKLQIPYYMIPKKIVFTSSFPLNVNGKTDRNKLELLFKNNL